MQSVLNLMNDIRLLCARLTVIINELKNALDVNQIEQKVNELSQLVTAEFKKDLQAAYQIVSARPNDYASFCQKLEPLHKKMLSLADNIKDATIGLKKQTKDARLETISEIATEIRKKILKEERLEGIVLTNLKRTQDLINAQITEAWTGSKSLKPGQFNRLIDAA